VFARGDPLTSQVSHVAADRSVDLDPRPIGTVLRDTARQTPQAPAVHWLRDSALTTLSYLDLDDLADECARRLLGSASPGERVAIAAATSVDWLIVEYAAAKAGLALVPLNPAFTDSEFRHILAATKPRVVFADVQFRDRPLHERIMRIAGPTARVCGLRQWGSLPKHRGQLPEITSADTFLIQPTSGTTGQPKAAVLSHRAAFNCAALSMVRFGGASDDRWLNLMPMHHVGGSVSVALAVLSVGASLALIPAFDAGNVLGLIETVRATLIGAVPTMQTALLDAPSFAVTDVSSVRLIQSGGSVVPPSLIRRTEAAFGATVCNAYGQSEAPNATMTSPDADIETKAETIGSALPQREVAIVDREGAPVPVGQVGELVMRSPMVMDRYEGVDRVIAAETLSRDGWLHTGDLCSMDHRNILRIRGRLRDVIIRGGENIYPAEVEGVLLRHPGVAEIAVVGVPDELWGEVPVGVYRARPGVTLDSEELEDFLRGSLAGFKVPRRWLEVQSFPTTASGKIKKFEVRAALQGIEW
jgi:fatty-acyl-CoA synthase